MPSTRITLPTHDRFLYFCPSFFQLSYTHYPMPRFNIHHITKYTYDGPVRDSANQILLFPIKDEFQEVLKQELIISGEPNVDIYKDYYGNEVGSFTRAEP